MRVIDIENITEAMRDDTRFVLRCEEVFHDKISAAAASILMNKSKKPLGPVRQTMGFCPLFIKMLAAAELILS